MAERAAERYLKLGLRLGRHVDGLVDSYNGPAEIAAEIDAEPLVDPATLASQAEKLLGELGEGWLRDQVLGLRTCAAFMAGEPGSYADEVEGCHGVRPTHTDEAVFAAAHEELEPMLPGDGPLAERYESWRRSTVVPGERVEGMVAELIEEARAWTRRVVELPDGEGVGLEIVRDRPWLAFCEYVGGLRSRISINVDIPISAHELLHLTSHETYPGHHTERACKDQLLVRGRGLVEETLVLVPTPQSLVSEGIAELAPELLLAGDSGERLTAVLRRNGIEPDLEEALAVSRAIEPCEWARVNVALMLHEHGASAADAQAYLERWALATPQVAAHVIRFMTEHSSRTYPITYAAGLELCRAYVGGDEGRFRRLLTEQVRVGDLIQYPRDA